MYDLVRCRSPARCRRRTVPSSRYVSKRKINKPPLLIRWHDQVAPCNAWKGHADLVDSRRWVHGLALMTMPAAAATRHTPLQVRPPRRPPTMAPRDGRKRTSCPGRHRSGAADWSPARRCRGGTVRAAPSASVRCRRATRAPWRTAVPGPTMPGPESDLAFGQSGLIRCTAGACALRLRRWRAATLALHQWLRCRSVYLSRLAERMKLELFAPNFAGCSGSGTRSDLYLYRIPSKECTANPSAAWAPTPPVPCA